MKKSRFTDEQIIGFLRQVEAGMSFSNFAWHLEKTNTSVNHNMADATSPAPVLYQLSTPKNALQQVNF
ncbi:MAG: hypothetical protein KGQ65_09745 [Burkholderiales bacterium]|nr:hypothetical protein [Burkholderiales bacterium]